MIDNSLSEYLYAIRKDCPGKTWWDGDFENRAPVYRALRIPEGAEGAVYALTPFRLVKIEDRWLILAAYPAPKIFEPVADWFDIEVVIAWEPNSDTARVLGDDADQLVGTLTDDANTIFTSPRAFFQAWAARRAQYAIQRQAYAGKSWHTAPAETDIAPGALLVGDLRKVRFSPSAMPADLRCSGIDPKELNRAIMRAANLPRVSAATHLRSAA